MFRFRIMGTEQHFLSLDSKDFCYGEDCRMRFLWDENSTKGVRIRIADAWTVKPKRVNDKALMDIFRRVEQDPIKLTRLNDVRIYLKVTYISCIANDQGDKLRN